MKLTQLSNSFQQEKPFVKIFLFFLLCQAYTINMTEARSFHLDYFHISPPHKTFSKEEKKLDILFSNWFHQQHIYPPRFDGSLREASWQLVHRLVKKPLKHLPYKTVQAAMWLAGNSDHQIRIFGMSFLTIQELKKTLYHSLATKLAGERPTHFGMAIIKKHNKRGICLMILARRGIQLSPIPRWVRVGQRINISGQLLAGFGDPQLIIGSPDGKVTKIRPKVNKNRSFSINWRASQIGYARIQLAVRNERGPWISSQFDLHIIPQKYSWSKVWKQDYQLKHKELWNTPKPKITRRIKKKWTAKAAAIALWKIVNNKRKLQMKRTLRRDLRLDLLARSHAQDMVQSGFFGHTSPQKGSFAERLKTLHWALHYARENIVVANTPQEAYILLLKSPSHRINLFSSKPIFTGVGAAIHPSGQIYFVQVFVKP